MIDLLFTASLIAIAMAWITKFARRNKDTAPASEPHFTLGTLVALGEMIDALDDAAEQGSFDKQGWIVSRIDPGMASDLKLLASQIMAGARIEPDDNRQGLRRLDQATRQAGD